LASSKVNFPTLQARYEDTDYRHGVGPYSCEPPPVPLIIQHTLQSSPSILRVFRYDSLYPNCDYTIIVSFSALLRVTSLLFTSETITAVAKVRHTVGLF